MTEPTLLQLSLLGGASFRAADGLLAGLTWAEANAPHAGLPHTLADVIWHLSVTQRASLNIASGRADGWPEGLNVWPERPLTEAGFLEALAELRAGLAEAQALARDPSSRARDVLTDLAVHSAYHWGQVALLRRLSGTLPPAGAGA
ncbi:DinB family protein [Deinococcus depolymerans]|uniref:DinB family protein n=1 Tax=Deinococcus depolymerans TaxID=392408 RepID=A0ABP3MHP7_9DEIO